MTDKIEKFIKKLDSQTKERLFKKIEEILKDPFSQRKLKKLKGSEDLFRTRIGDIRIIIKISKDKLPEIVNIDYRKDVY